MADTYRARFRFRLLKRLRLALAEHPITFEGREVVLSALGGGGIQNSEWLVMNARGFTSEVDARAFGCRLRAAAEVSSVAARLGIDAGRDLPTSSLGTEFRTQLRNELGIDCRPNVHGVDVLVDDPNVRFTHFSGTGSVLASAPPFLDGLQAQTHAPEDLSAEARDVVLLLNFALMRPEPVAQIVFSISAVEMLGQRRDWSPAQQKLLADLVEVAEHSTTGTESERSEVVDALAKGVHKVSLRQGVLRLLEDLGLGALRKPWDKIYSDRSSLVHGLAPRPGADYSELAHRTVGICGRILLRFVARELPNAEQHVDTFYSPT